MPEPLVTLLRSGPQEVVIYGDGSYSCDLLVGAWAAHVPSFGLQIVGSGPGPSAGHCEFCSMVEGMRGATTGVAAGDPVAAFQSTRPTRGATLCSLCRHFRVDVSIHAPHEGRDIH